jgi:hypothetical protein
MDEEKNYTAKVVNALEAIYSEAAANQIRYLCKSMNKDVPEDLNSRSFDELYGIALCLEAEWFERVYGIYLNKKEPEC